MSHTKEEFNKQANEIISTNGKCPSNMLCDYCICKPLLSHGIGCNPEKAVNYIKKLIKNDNWHDRNDDLINDC
jgi:hypothetical protein